MTIVTLGIDLGKTVCSLAGFDEDGRVVLRRRIRRDRLVAFTANLPRCTVAMEACCGAHHLGRAFVEQGHEARLMPAEYVRPYVKAHKNDDRDAEAIAEAATRPTMRFVPLKSAAQLDTQTLHRVRRAPRRAPHRADQPDARDPPRAWARSGEGSKRLGARAARYPGGGGERTEPAYPQLARGHARGVARSRRAHQGL
jgi:hypothetical protein